ncbi:MAG: hypothetical protein Q8K02_03520, partial [Flavobacterium sp.]|nr:hypothetical protein [Flavobacterium sp.]
MKKVAIILFILSLFDYSFLSAQGKDKYPDSLIVLSQENISIHIAMKDYGLVKSDIVIKTIISTFQEDIKKVT